MYVFLSSVTGNYRYSFYVRGYAKRVYAMAIPSVHPSVCHTCDLWRNELIDHYDIYTANRKMTLVCSDEISALQIQGFTTNDPVKEGTPMCKA